MEKRFGKLSSSANPQELSATVQGLIISFATLIIFVAKQFDIVITTEEISNIAVIVGSAAGTVLTLSGLIRKLVVWGQSKLTDRG